VESLVPSQRPALSSVGREAGLLGGASLNGLPAPAPARGFGRGMRSSKPTGTRALSRNFGSMQSLSLEKSVVQDNVPAEIASGLYIGSIHAAFNSEFLLSRRIFYIVNASGVEATFPRKFTYLTVEVRDKEYADILSCVPFVHTFVSNALKRGGSVLIHCNGGRSRSAALSCAHLMLVRGISFEEAQTIVYRARPVCNINKGFQQQLRAFDRAQRNIVLANQILLRVRLAEVSKKKADEELRGLKHKRRLSSKVRCNAGEPNSKSRTFQNAMEEDEGSTRPSPGSCSRKDYERQSTFESEALSQPDGPGDLPPGAAEGNPRNSVGASAPRPESKHASRAKGGLDEIRGKVGSKIRFCHSSTGRVVAIPMMRSLEKSMCCRQCKQRLVYYRSIVRLDMSVPDICRADLDPPTPRDATGSMDTSPALPRKPSNRYRRDSSQDEYSPLPTPKASQRGSRRVKDSPFQLTDNSSRGSSKALPNPVEGRRDARMKEEGNGEPWNSPLASRTPGGRPLDYDEDEAEDGDEAAVPVTGDLELESVPPKLQRNTHSFPKLSRTSMEERKVSNVEQSQSASVSPAVGLRRSGSRSAVQSTTLPPVLASAPHLRVETQISSPQTYMELMSVSDTEDIQATQMTASVASTSTPSFQSLASALSTASLDDVRARQALEAFDSFRDKSDGVETDRQSGKSRKVLVPKLRVTMNENPLEIGGAPRRRRRSRSLSLSSYTETEQWVALVALLEEAISPKRTCADICLAINQPPVVEAVKTSEDHPPDIDIMSARSHQSAASVSSLASDPSEVSDAGGMHANGDGGEDFATRAAQALALCEVDNRELKIIEATVTSPHGEHAPKHHADKGVVFVEWLPWMGEIQGRTECRGSEVAISCPTCGAQVGAYGWDWELLPMMSTPPSRDRASGRRRSNNPQTHLPLPYFRLECSKIQCSTDSTDMGGCLPGNEPAINTPGRALPSKLNGHVDATIDDSVVRADDMHLRRMNFALGTCSSPELLAHTGSMRHSGSGRKHFDFVDDEERSSVDAQILERLPQL